MTVCVLALGLLAMPALAVAELGDSELRRGMRGDDVRELQTLLTRLGFRTGTDGVFGRGTERSVRSYETRERLRVDGRVSRGQAAGMKRRALRPRPRRPASTRSSRTYAFGERTLRRGLRGGDVSELQTLLTELGFRTGTDGVFGRGTERSVRSYETRERLRVDGRVSRGQAAGMKRRRSRPRSTMATDASHVFPIRGRYRYGGGFGEPRGGRSHRGQDILAASGTPLVSVTSGRVAYRQYQAGGAGNYVVIRGDDGTDYVYMHLRSPASVAPGETVTGGQVIGQVGSTGRSSAPHLHFELWTAHWYDGGQAFDPRSRLASWEAGG